MIWRGRIALVISTLCLAWCVVVGFVIWFTPMRYVGTSGGVPTSIDRSFSEVSGNGALPLVIPVLIAGLALGLAAFLGTGRLEARGTT